MSNRSHSGQHGLVGNVRPKSKKRVKRNKVNLKRNRMERRQITGKN